MRNPLLAPHEGEAAVWVAEDVGSAFAAVEAVEVAVADSLAGVAVEDLEIAAEEPSTPEEVVDSLATEVASVPIEVAPAEEVSAPAAAGTTSAAEEEEECVVVETSATIVEAAWEAEWEIIVVAEQPVEERPAIR